VRQAPARFKLRLLQDYWLHAHFGEDVSHVFLQNYGVRMFSTTSAHAAGHVVLATVRYSLGLVCFSVLHERQMDESNA
jgi:hypothetical protein